jgi:hypothetical protein
MAQEATKEYGTNDGKSRLIYAISEAQADTVNVRIEEVNIHPLKGVALKEIKTIETR